MKAHIFASAGAAILLASAGAAGATTIDFSTYAQGTPITTVGDATFSLQGGPATGTPVTGSFGTPSLGNSPTGDYPTAEVLDVAFATPITGLSFTFDNFGDNSSFSSSFATAYNSSGTVVGSEILSGPTYAATFAPGAIAGTGITDLKFDNGSGGNYNWEFGVQEITYAVSAAPEPSTWALMIAGLGGIGLMLRRAKKTMGFGFRTPFTT